MKLAMIRFCMAALAMLAATNGARAQVMLIGCTANTTNTTPPSSIVDINILTGASTNPRNTGVFLIGGIATQPSTGNLFGLTTFASTPANTLIRIDPNSATITPIGPTGLTNIVEGDIAFNPLNGFLYGIQDFGPSFNQRNLFRLDPNTGAATVIGSMDSQGDYSALAFNAAGTLFAIDTSGPNSRLHIVDPNTGMITGTTSMNVSLGGAAGLTFNPLTGTAFVADGGAAGMNKLYTLDISTGLLTLIGPTGATGGIGGLAFVNVPEPSSLTLACMGCLFAGRRILRSRR
jgi:DNA-binding beta-propeller fold protein YncE